MNYSGVIVGIQPKSGGSIYATDLGKDAIVWSADIEASITESNTINIRFVFMGHVYSIILKNNTDTTLKGEILYDGMPGGKLYVWWFKNHKSQFILQGDWEEDDSGHYDCLIKLSPAQKKFEAQ